MADMFSANWFVLSVIILIAVLASLLFVGAAWMNRRWRKQPPNEQ